jgi:predicted small integral membrane protein
MGIFMVHSATTKTISAVIAAAVLASLAVFLTTAAPQANAQSAVGPLSQALAKGDRLPILVKGAACSTRAWPNYEQNCEFDLRKSADDVQKVRVVGLTRS